MKNSLILLAGLLASTALWSQTFSESDLQSFNQKRLQITRTGMLTLGGWALANMTIGSIGLARTSGSTRYFHQMNLFWNIVNAGLATAGYLSASGSDPAAFNITASISEQMRMEKILLLNAGLDVGYIALGLFLNERGLRKDQSRLKGYGKSLLVQGGFLLLFDIGLYLVLHQNFTNFQILNHIQLSWTGTGMSIKYPL
jgi:hypothetical protein